ncbi:hypothetical protein RD110_15740 [Rhodoferax koreense]|uniref:Uncharacterized protein n=1 Tax=Rhodoferax koreensis TaxID=1842727 RepID=A0A1P8JXJ5_9BURK|nr:hypothetical protein [Rhodoferax koreense]APW38473.1 hypothetical protein RD110_15740 [Rhodoferax koreense]
MTSLTDRKTLEASAQAAAKEQLETGVPQHNPWAELSDNGVVWREAFDAEMAKSPAGAEA